MVRRALRLMLQNSGEVEIAGEAGTGEEALRQARAAKPDIAVMDIHLPDFSGLEASRQLLREFPQLKIIILSGDVDTNSINEALQLGVSAYLLKTSAEEELQRAIKAVLEGRIYLCPDVNSVIIQNYQTLMREKSGVPKPALSTRELEVLRLIAHGKQVKEIAAELEVGVRTVETFRRRLAKKLNLHGTAELTRYAIREGIVSL